MVGVSEEGPEGLAHWCTLRSTANTGAQGQKGRQGPHLVRYYRQMGGFYCKWSGKSFIVF